MVSEVAGSSIFGTDYFFRCSGFLISREIGLINDELKVQPTYLAILENSIKLNTINILLKAHIIKPEVHLWKKLKLWPVEFNFG